MHPFESHIEQTISRHGLLRRSSPVLVALSGGADSVALLSALTALGYECIAAHCNFHLRGAESIRDMRHAEKIAAQLGTNIYIKEFNVAEHMSRSGESIEMACRSLRYNWFHELLDRDFSQAIAVGHHREDNVETFFINLMRSSGIDGLTGMDYRRGYVVRPMLDLSRLQIEDYLNYKGLNYVEDSSNAKNDYVRNRIRNVILPTLEQHFPNATEAILATMQHLRDARLLVDNTLKTALGDDKPNKAIDIKSIVDLYGEKMARAILFEGLKTQGFTATQIDNMLRSVNSGSSGVHFEIDGDQIAELDRGILTFTDNINISRLSEQYDISLKHDILKPIHIQISPHHVTEFKPERNPDIMYLDVSAETEDARFILRHPQVGDKMRPFGMKGEKLVSDILKDAKFSAAQKRNCWILTRNDEILWIVGIRASARFSISPRTRRYLRLEFIKN